MRTTDYTKVPVGTKLDEGEVYKCPHCGRPGLLEIVNEKKWFTHSQSVGFTDKGIPQILWDMCPRLEEINVKTGTRE